MTANRSQFGRRLIEGGIARSFFVLVALLLPVGAVLLQRALAGGTDGFRLDIFVFFALSEVSLVLFLTHRERGSRNSQTRFRLWHYLAHTALGLPATAYLATGSPLPEVALLRQFVVLLLLVERRVPWSSFFQHEALLLVGIFAFGFREWLSPVGAAVWVHLAEQLALFAVACFCRILWQELGRSSRTLLFSAEKARRRGRVVARRLELLTGLAAPPAQARYLATGQTPPPEHGHYVCLTIDCSGAHAAHDFFRTHSPISQRAGLEEFLLEWDRFLGFASERAGALGFDKAGGGTFLRFIRQLTAAQAGARKSEHRSALGRALELGRVLSAMSERSTRALQARGQDGWTVACTAQIMDASASSTRLDPWWTLRGSGVRGSEEFLTRLRSERLTARVWIPDEEFGLVAQVLEPADLVRMHGWTGAGLLRARYSVDGNGIEFAKNAWERLRDESGHDESD